MTCREENVQMCCNGVTGGHCWGQSATHQPSGRHRVRFDLVSGNAQTWFSRLTCSETRLQVSDAAPITFENGAKMLLQAPFCVFSLLFLRKSSLMSASSRLQSLSYRSLLRKLRSNLLLGSLPVIVGETQTHFSRGRCYSSPRKRSCTSFAS